MAQPVMAQPVLANPAPAPLVWLLLLLSATTGMVDAASILGMGKVFTANMTGNVVFLGFAAAATPGFVPLPYLLALGAFMLGAVAAGRIGRASRLRKLHHQLMVAAVIESGLLALAGLFALSTAFAAGEAEARVLPMIALTAGAMGFRNATVRQLKVPDLTTTVLTLTITGIAADAHRAEGAAPVMRTRLGAVAMVLAGATFGAVLFARFGMAATLFTTAAIVLLGTLAFARHPHIIAWQR
ncbi:YoaK family protein [Novosphingobium sp.]|uniref:YoaK family protein n=1 Tax=Novosphingobium sp. TaxID=1874826 RepID=UPI0038B82136